MSVSQLKSMEKFQPEPNTSATSEDGGDGTNGDDGTNIEGRLARLETHIQYLATKEDIQRIETLIEKKESSILKWLGTLITAALISIVVALFRTFWS